MPKIVGHIYSTNNYSQFKRLDNNRKLLESRLSKLVASFGLKEIMNPIIVNENMEIIDGQGRFEAKKMLNRPIYYIVQKGATIEDCRRMNKYNTPWSVLDFCKSYADAGIKSYIRLLGTCKESGFPISRVLRLSNHSTNSKSKAEIAKKPIEEGKLLFTEKDRETVLRVKKMSDDISEALLITQRKNDAFYTGIKIITETDGYNHSKMIENCKKNRTTYVAMAALEDQLKEFSRIYNYKTKASNRIYFEDYMRNKGYNIRSYNTEPFNKELEGEDVSTLKVKKED